MMHILKCSICLFLFFNVLTGFSQLKRLPLELVMDTPTVQAGFICNFRYFPKLDIGYAFFTNNDMDADLSIPLLTQFIATGKK